MVDWSDWNVHEVEDVSFAYPSVWSPEMDRSEDGVSVLIQSDAVSFGVVGVYPPDYAPEDLTEQVLESVREEHPGLEVEELDSPNQEFPDASAFEGLFMTLDTVAYCWVRSWRLPSRTVLVFIQSIQAESAEGEEVFSKICQSVRQEST